MYLSRIKLNTECRKTMAALISPNLFHGAIESSEQGDRTRKLWRIDTLMGEKYLLILTKEQIDFSQVAQQFGYDNYVESKCYDTLLDRITDGSKWQFRLKANPTIQKFVKNRGKGSRGKVNAHITTEFQEEWLKNQSAKNGFSLNDGEWLVDGSQWYIFRKNKNTYNKIRMLSATYSGILTVTDSQAFKNALINGIGREKAYGLGLITISGIRK